MKKTIVEYIGNYNSQTGKYLYYEDASKKKGICANLINEKYAIYDENDFQEIHDCGYAIDFEDTLIDYTVNEDDIYAGINKRIIIGHAVFSNNNIKVIEDVESTLFYPSIITEKEHRNVIQRLKNYYIKNMGVIKKGSMFQLWNETKCGMGLTIKTSTGQSILINNRVGSRAFNVFNSHFLGMEIHCDFDLLMTMACFLKYNSICGGGLTISLKNFDYVSTFFGKDLCKLERSSNCDTPYMFLVERSMLINNYEVSKRRAHDAIAMTRLINSENDEPPMKKMKFISLNKDKCDGFEEKINNIIKITGNLSLNCKHEHKIPLDGILPLDESDEVICLKCFVSMFFFDWDLSISIHDFNDLIKTIQKWMKKKSTIDTKANMGLQLLVQCIRMQMGSIYTRGLNWPLEAMNNKLYEYYTFVLSQLLEADRWKGKNGNIHSDDEESFNNGDMGPGLLYSKLNLFGKTLLLLMANCTVYEYNKDFSSKMNNIISQMKNKTIPQTMDSILVKIPCNRLIGKWFNIYHRGPSVWNFQTYSMKILDKQTPSLSLESRRMIPTSPEDNECCTRMFFKIHCRGGDVSKRGELVSDVCNSVLEMQKIFNNKKFKFNKERNIIETKTVIGNPIVSLEVTNHRPLKCSLYKNGSLISNRLTTLLNIKSGSRIKIAKSKYSSVVFVEDLRDNVVSNDACNRLLTGSKILYYDIETTSLNPSSSDAMITSIGCTLSKNDDGTKERSIFAYSKHKKEKLKEKIIELYNKANTNDDYHDYTKKLPIPNISVAETEIELLTNFAMYIKKCYPLTFVSGWNNNAFDEPYLFITIYKYLCRDNYCNNKATANENQLLISGLFDFSSIMTSNNTTVIKSKLDSISKAIRIYNESEYNYQKNNISMLNKLISCLAVCPCLDMMKCIGKKYAESLPSMSLNTVLEHLCSISNTDAVQKDPIDVKYHLLGYRDRNVEENALVQKYCCKDAYLVSKPAERVGILSEIIQLSKESNMNMSVICALYSTQLQIIDGAVLRAMGSERAFMRSCALRHHSQYTKTLGGYVTTPLAKFQTLHTMDMSSLYPSAMRQNNLDTTTVCSHRQVMDVRNRRMLTSMVQGSLLDIMDEANAFVMARYRPCDLVVDSWKNNRPQNIHWVSRNDFENDNIFHSKKKTKNDDDDDATTTTKTSVHNCINQVTDLGYFPEVACHADLQLAALVNDDSHVEICSLEYMLPFLIPMMIDNPSIIPEITSNTTQDFGDVITMLEKDFSEKDDDDFIKYRLKYEGGKISTDIPSRNIEERSKLAIRILENDIHNQSNNKRQNIKTASRLIALCARIARRVYVYDSARDEAVIKWSNRLINVGNRCRVWNARQWVLQGHIPKLQRRYRAERVELKRQLKIKAKSEPLVAAQLKVEEGVKKIFMNSIYGILVLRNGEYNQSSISKWNIENSPSRLLIGNSAAVEGVGGGTRHAPMGNQITQISRRIFLNITPSIRHFFPNCIQGYGDTDSVFEAHNFPGEMTLTFEQQRDANGKYYPAIEMDLVLREKIAYLLQIIVNSTTKGIRFNAELAAGEEAMAIEHERLSIITHTAGKKTYHMMHFREDEPLYVDLVKTLINLNESLNVDNSIDIIEKFRKNNPASRIVALVKNVHYPHYVYPHNTFELCRLLNMDEQAIKLCRKIGNSSISGLIFDRESKDGLTTKKISKFLSASKYIAVFKMEAMLNAFCNGFLDIPAESDKLIELSTGTKFGDSEKIKDTLMALKLVNVYKKGKFTKKGISQASKLREIQTACLAWTQQFFTYDTIVSEHAKRCMSYIENPEKYIMFSRVNKEQEPSNNIISLPNPTARLINNHLNPSKTIDLSEKFLTVLAMSGKILAYNNKNTKQLLSLEKKRWDPVLEKGIVSVSSVKNLGVICYTLSSITDLIKRDCESILKIINSCLDSLYNVSKGEGFSLAYGSLGYNTGILTAEVLTRFLLSINKMTTTTTTTNNTYDVMSTNLVNNNNNNNFKFSDDTLNHYYDEYKEKEEKNTNEEKVKTSMILLKPLLTKVNAILTNLSIGQGQIGVPQMIHTNNNTTILANLEEKINLLEKLFLCNSSVFIDLKNFIRIWSRAREYKIPKKENEETPLSHVIDNSTQPCVIDILISCANHLKNHTLNCKHKLFTENMICDEKIFIFNLMSILGKEKCLETCIHAGADALYFNLLYSVFLRREREKYGKPVLLVCDPEETFYDIFNKKEEIEIVKRYYKIITENDMVRACFVDRYNPATDSLVYLTEPKEWLSGVHKHTQNNMLGIDIDRINSGIGEGSAIIQNQQIGPILLSSNIKSFPSETDMTENQFDDDDDYFEKEYDNISYIYKKKNLIFRPGFFNKTIVEKMYAALATIVINKKCTI
nr:MAG: wsv514-like protein [Metapenaeopsis lamellata majanivirus]